MIVEDKPQFKELMFELAAPFGKAGSIDRYFLKSWYEALQEFEIHDIRVVFKELISSNEWFPKPFQAKERLEIRVKTQNQKYSTSLSDRDRIELAHEKPVIDRVYSSALMIFWDVFVCKDLDLLERFRGVFWSMRRCRSMADNELKIWCNQVTELIEEYESQYPHTDMKELLHLSTNAFRILNPDCAQNKNKLHAANAVSDYIKETHGQTMIPKSGELTEAFIQTHQMIADEFRAVQHQLEKRWKELDAVGVTYKLRR
jgi:hypothetical protein